MGVGDFFRDQNKGDLLQCGNSSIVWSDLDVVFEQMSLNVDRRSITRAEEILCEVKDELLRWERYVETREELLNQSLIAIRQLKLSFDECSEVLKARSCLLTGDEDGLNVDYHSKLAKLYDSAALLEKFRVRYRTVKEGLDKSKSELSHARRRFSELTTQLADAKRDLAVREEVLYQREAELAEQVQQTTRILPEQDFNGDGGGYSYRLGC